MNVLLEIFRNKSIAAHRDITHLGTEQKWFYITDSLPGSMKEQRERVTLMM